MPALTVTPQGDREIVITRQFAAPRTLVFRCLTTPALLQQWLLGPPGWTLEVREWDFRVGGRFRWVWVKPGKEMGMGGTFQEVVPPARLVHTERFDEDWTNGEALATTELTEDAGRTTLTLTMRYASRDARDGVMKSGMETGMAASYDRLDEVLATLDT